MWTLTLTKMGLPPTSILESHLLSFICLSLSVGVDHGDVQALEKLSGPLSFWPFLFSFPSPLRLDPTTKHFCFCTCQLYFFTSFPSVLPLQVTEQSSPRGINHLLFLLLKKECVSSKWERSRGTYWFRYWIFSLNLTLRNPLLYSWFYSTMQLPQIQTSLSQLAPLPVFRNYVCQLSNSDTQSHGYFLVSQNHVSFPRPTATSDWPWTFLPESSWTWF